MDDRAIYDRINELAGEEHELYQRLARGEVGDVERDRLQRLETTLDQCWDLLHQRRARRAAGLNPDEARTRDEDTIRGYVG